MHSGLLYRASVAVCGGCLGAAGLSMLLSGHVTLTAVLLSVGGVGMVGAVAYDAVVSTGSLTTVPDDRVVAVTTTMALLTVVGGLWEAVV
ncbi:hypothetical protein [Halobellus ruber]|uniref:Uncharacterized protein n=1 Tax=Halobellus ruber TaxID=2761102 RepID=A0A7J9SDB6_9EURY|nr:hypothetical protein [Halobellus ruber]MBB6644914.1 hypothetical protein [Halobellus ruber]